jgi:aspartyl/asparaginyl-tRNA synthetase
MFEKFMENPMVIDSLCVIIVALTGYLLTYINKKKQMLQLEMDNELVTKYTDMLEQVVVDCVSATNQIYVDALKKEGAFTAEAQKKAFKMTYDNIMTILNEECLEFLGEITSDVEAFIVNKIEAEVNFAK